MGVGYANARKALKNKAFTGSVPENLSPKIEAAANPDSGIIAAEIINKTNDKQLSILYRPFLP